MAVPDGEGECAEAKYWSSAEVECVRRWSSPEPSPAQQNLRRQLLVLWKPAWLTHCSMKLFMLARETSLLSLLELGLHLARATSGGDRGESVGVSVAELDPSS